MTISNNLEPDFSKMTFYTVEKNDTLRKISEKFFGNPEEYIKIMEINDLKSTNIFPGQILRIPQSIDSNIIFYRVKKGDTLWSISKKFLDYAPRYQEIMFLNGLTNDIIYPGQIIKIPVGTSISTNIYTVKRGDTLWKIATNFLGDGKKYTEIMKINNINNTELSVGQKLILPKI